jgi:hypothetical protein
VALLLGWSVYSAVPRFSMAAYLATKLNPLVGQTGLDPLDPVQPLARAELVDLMPGMWSLDLPRVRFTYADGTGRDYVVMLSHKQTLLGGWLYSGVDRVLAPHQELPGLPLVNSASGPLRVGAPQRLVAVDTVAGTPAASLGSALDWGGLARWPGWSAGGDAVAIPLDAAELNAVRRELWLFSVRGDESVRVAGDVWAGQWSPDGRWLAYVESAGHGAARLVLADRTGARRWSFAPLMGRHAWAAGAVGVYIVGDGSVSVLPYDAVDGTEPALLRDLPDTTMGSLADGAAIAVSPDGASVAYACGPSLCMAEVRGGGVQRAVLEPLGVPVFVEPTQAPGIRQPCPPPSAATPSMETNGLPGSGVADRAPLPMPTSLPAGCLDPSRPNSRAWPAQRMAWSADGRRLAVARSATDGQPRLTIFDRAGAVLIDVAAGPNGPLEVPQWTPDGTFIFLPAYPEHGRRILVVESASGRLLDLSQPRWDAVFSLSPDGTRLLLASGRGGWWVALVERTLAVLP